ncbi:hypothetical protein F0562_024095 [Nyssa sinensis]|uniref:Uncharacterized protein n=1 Tax=Nyssa sinensis TaxID=561372 RepID=A0A5J5BIH1_9ASTE|nr:hypothetical protein F0562_024095 [Nyssa sinensis]
MGNRAIAEIQFADYIYLAFDQVMNKAAVVVKEEELEAVQELVVVDDLSKYSSNGAENEGVVVEAAKEVLSALSVIKKSKLDLSRFLEKLGGSKSLGRTWMLIFTAKSGLKNGGYVPITAVQRFDATKPSVTCFLKELLFDSEIA